MTTGGVKRVLYKFRGGADGGNPYGRLVDVNGTLYGTTSSQGAACGCGTVYSITPSGSEKVLYRFAGGKDGANPEAGLVDVNGVLYGTTTLGGVFCVEHSSVVGCGTVYGISTTGKERVLYRFESDPDGAFPNSGLIRVGDTLYGTTQNGGYDYGTVFSVTQSGAEKTVYHFAGPPDGAYPMAQLTDFSGTLYGTTGGGGASKNGTVFNVSTAGVEHVIFSFPLGSSAGYSPDTPLTYFGGKFYVARRNGGYRSRCGVCGQLYSITPEGTATVLHQFAGGLDGCEPSTGLLAVNGVLYGGTEFGGQANHNCGIRTVGGHGTIYSWTP